MVNLLFLSPSSTSSTFPLSALPTDSIHVLKVQLAALHPSCPRVEDVQLVRGGRFLNDQETVQDVLGLGKAEREEEEEDGRPHTIHLVLRGGGQGGEKREVMSSSMERTTTTTTSLPPPSMAAAAAPTTPILPPPPSTPSPSSSAPTILLPPDRVLDLSDAVGLYAHLSRSSLCTLLNLPSLAWEDILPPPQVSEAEAKRLVKQTVEGFGVQSGFGEEEEEGEGGRLEDWVGEDGGEWSVEVE
ncbi:hypothetical protein BDY24DRAFT_381504 [Mrakia frigida]|uniref:uncharacterized protein n=1 Tax=Mrakia frigida TaxID=29902 RepID=UPI003FCBF221